MTTDLTEIDGVGPASAEKLESDGYESVADVADADPDALDDLVPAASGDEIVSNAQDEAALGNESDEAVADEAEAVEDDDVSDTDEPETESETDDGPEVFTLEPGFSTDQENHLISALIDEEVKSRRRNNSSRLEDTQGAIAQIRAGEPYELTLDQLSIAYTATNQLESEYRGTRGLASFVSEVRELSQYFQNARRQNWPDSE